LFINGRSSEQAILVGAGLSGPIIQNSMSGMERNNPLKLILSGSGIFDKESVVNETNDKAVIFTI